MWRIARDPWVWGALMVTGVGAGLAWYEERQTTVETAEQVCGTDSECEEQEWLKVEREQWRQRWEQEVEQAERRARQEAEVWI